MATSPPWFGFLRCLGGETKPTRKLGSTQQTHTGVRVYVYMCRLGLGLLGLGLGLGLVLVLVLE